VTGTTSDSSYTDLAESYPRHIDGCFFFGRGSENREKASFFPATIAFQLCRSRASCRTAINKVIERRPEILSADFPSQFRHLLTKAAQTTGFLQGPITIVIDGLDECNSAPDQVKLLELILGAVKTGNMRFFIASRPEQHIHAFFHRSDVSHHTWHVQLDEETFNTSQDIKVFLREEFARIRQANPEPCLRLPNGEEWPGERVLDHLTVKSDSQFMFPILAIGFIDTPFFPPDKQLQILLEAPPSGAFSALDNLYHKILSRRPPAKLVHGEDDLRAYQEVVMEILRVIIAWSGNPLSAAKIAAVLDKPVDVVERIVRGPMRTLFKFHTSEPDSPIALCHKSLRDYLLSRKRSQEFFIPSAEEDDLFVAILSRPNFHPACPNVQAIVMDVLNFVCAVGSDRNDEFMASSVSEIAAFLDVESTLVDHVLNIGPTNLLFDVWEDGVDLCSASFEAFLQDPYRSGPFLICTRRVDALFIQALSRQPSSESTYPWPADVLLDILAAVPVDLGHHPRRGMTINQVAALLEVDASVVEHVVTSGAAEWLVLVDEHNDVLSTNHWVHDFLRNRDRSGEFFISSRRLDPIFIRILSQKSPPGGDPSHSSSHAILMGVLTAIMGSWSWEGMNIRTMASLLGVDPVSVESVVKFGPTSPLFNVNQDRVTFSIASLDAFLSDSDRSGTFFISNGRMDTFFTRILSRRPPPDSSNNYSRVDLLDILAMILSPSQYGASVGRVAAFFGVDSSIVEHVAKVGTTWLFTGDDWDGISLSIPKLKGFLLDADRSGEFCISDRRLDPFIVQILSRQSPSGSLHSEATPHDILLRVLAAIVAFEGKLTIDGIASAIGVDPVFVEGVVKVEQKGQLFDVEESGVKFAWSFLEAFLQDATRSGTFHVSQSSIDALFIHALSRGTTFPRAHPHSQDLLMDVLTVILIMSDVPSDLTLRRVAAFLDVDPGLVEGVVLGPAKAMFRTTHNNVTSFATALIRPFLQNVDRSGDFCITERRLDSLFLRFLSRQPPSGPLLLSHTQNIQMNVLSVISDCYWWQSMWSVSLLAAFLDVDPTIIDGVVNTGGPRLLFSLYTPSQDRVVFSASLLGSFLEDASRSGEFFISNKSLDPFFIRMLSSPSPLAGLRSKTQDILRDVLIITLVAQKALLTVLSVGAALDVNPSLVDGAIKFGPTRPLFSVQWFSDASFTFSTPALRSFLQDVERSGEFYISDDRIDALFTRILSLPPPPHFTHPYSRNILLGVMTVILASPVSLTVPKIAALLEVDCSFVEGVAKIMPAKVLFSMNTTTFEVNFSGPFLKPFLQDANRSGDFFIPPTTTVDDILKPWLQHPSSSSKVSSDEIEEAKVYGGGDEMKGKESTAGEELAWQKAADLGTASQGPAPTLPIFVRPKRKFSR